MSDNAARRKAVKEFVKEWTGKGYEKGETQRFWLSLLQDVFGVTSPMAMMVFELPVKTITKEKGSDFIDAYIPATKVLIEQKGSHVDLKAKSRQSDGSELTPYQQARRYAAGLPGSQYPRWIVTSNFKTFQVYDMERPNDAPEVIQLADLEKEYHRLSFLVDDTNAHIKKELEVSIQVGEIVGVLYDKLLAQYRDPSNLESQKSLNKLCVRLVFCLYAEDAVPNHEALLGKSYCFVLDADPATIVCAFTLSSDSVHVDHLPNARKKKINSRIAHPKQKRRYPAILIGRLAVNEEFADKGIGSEMLSAIKQFSTDPDNLADCRFLAVDAKNEEKPLHYYEKNDFRYLYSSEEQEAENLDLPLPLKTRFMFFDLIDLKKS